MTMPIIETISEDPFGLVGVINYETNTHVKTYVDLAFRQTGEKHEIHNKLYWESDFDKLKEKAQRFLGEEDHFWMIKPEDVEEAHLKHMGARFFEIIPAGFVYHQYNHSLSPI